ncbi:MAG TPA: trypsin-like peptidase domain-containing protein [Bryobacteraceae bacterium]|nr:trypsin-like peptidase domain-containing protein [Bryobacteraceae bacterium]
MNTLSALSSELAGAVERGGQAVVAVHGRHHIPSSGVLWRPGIVVTAEHTLKRDEEITVALPDGRNAPATLAGRDPGTDLAVLKVDSGDAAVAKFGDTAALKTGHLVLALGRSSERGVTATLGVISGLSGPWKTWRAGHVDQLIRLDVSVYPGFSGGPLVNTDGRILGVNTSGLSRVMAVTIPVATASRVIQDLLEKGRVARGYLGLGMHPVNLPDGRAGVIVISVQPDGPAGKAGVLIGDVLLELNGAAVSDNDDVHVQLGPESVGKRMKARIVRGGSDASLEITVGERPQGE